MKQICVPFVFTDSASIFLLEHGGAFIPECIHRIQQQNISCWHLLYTHRSRRWRAVLAFSIFFPAIFGCFPLYSNVLFLIIVFGYFNVTFFSKQTLSALIYKDVQEYFLDIWSGYILSNFAFINKCVGGI